MLNQTSTGISPLPPSLTPVMLGDFSKFVKKSPPRRVLVVDDEPLLRWSIAETLGANGYEVVEAGDGDSAVLALFDPHPPDMVLLDLRLPDSDDLRVLEVMRRLKPATPIILMTAYITPEVTERARKLGALTVVAKPFEMSVVVPLVEGALRRWRRAR